MDEQVQGGNSLNGFRSVRETCFHVRKGSFISGGQGIQRIASKMGKLSLPSLKSRELSRELNR